MDAHIGFAATNEIQKLLQKDTVTIEQVFTFKREARSYVVATLKKIYAKCSLLLGVVNPLSANFTKCSSTLNL